MTMLTRLAGAMRRLATWRILALSGAGFVGAAFLFFATSLPFAIPTVTALCNDAPPDMRFYTSGRGVREFLDGCGEPGRLAYVHLQLADLFYPAISGLFLASALAMVLVRLAGPSSAIAAAAALPLLGAMFDYLENTAAWGALAVYPESAMTADLLGYATVAKQVCSWASWALLIVATLLLLIRVVRSRGSRRPSRFPAVGDDLPRTVDFGVADPGTSVAELADRESAQWPSPNEQRPPLRSNPNSWLPKPV